MELFDIRIDCMLRHLFKRKKLAAAASGWVQLEILADFIQRDAYVDNHKILVFAHFNVLGHWCRERVCEWVLFIAYKQLLQLLIQHSSPLSSITKAPKQPLSEVAASS